MLNLMRVGLAVVLAGAAACGGPEGPTPVLPSAIESSTDAKPGGDIPVVTSIADSQNGYLLRVHSDGAGSYLNGSAGQSLISGNLGDWTMNTYTTRGGKIVPSSRKVFFDLTEPVVAGGPAPPFQTALETSHLIAKCHLVGIGLLAIQPGQTVACPGAFRFLAPSGLWYRLSFQPDNYPGVDYMAVTCLSADTKGCLQWTIAPNGTTRTGIDPNPKNVNKLLQIDSPATDGVVAELGDYYISFFITLTR